MSTSKYCRLMHEGKSVWGLISEETIQILEGNLFDQFSITDRKVALIGSKLLPPVTPSKIVCVGLNYADHVKESQSSNVVPQEPVLFMKPLTALIGPEDKIISPPQSQRVDYEGEIGVVIGKRCKGLSPEEVAKNIFGVTCVNDVTARDLQKKDLQWTRGKGFDTFCPAGPYLVTGLDLMNLNVTSRLNGETRQSSNSRNMIFSITELISFINEIMTLLPGDLIATGTPEGVGPMKSGDVVEVEVEGVGILRNQVQRNG
jgi:2-keto-4-pentenoate hydratase/2-oxohepta-3-ene-1,7-dioic acid hydratase in catechol pathway